MFPLQTHSAPSRCRPISFEPTAPLTAAPPRDRAPQDRAVGAAPLSIGGASSPQHQGIPLHPSEECTPGSGGAVSVHCPPERMARIVRREPQHSPRGGLAGVTPVPWAATPGSESALPGVVVCVPRASRWGRSPQAHRGRAGGRDGGRSEAKGGASTDDRRPEPCVDGGPQTTAVALDPHHGVRRTRDTASAGSHTTAGQWEGLSHRRGRRFHPRSSALRLASTEWCRRTRDSPSPSPARRRPGGEAADPGQDLTALSLPHGQAAWRKLRAHRSGRASPQASWGSHSIQDFSCRISPLA